MIKQTTIFAAHTYRRQVAIGLVLIGIFALADFVGTAKYLRQAVEMLIRPSQLVSAKIVSSTYNPVATLQSLQTAQRRIQDLELRYAEASAQLGEMDRLKAENKALRDMLNASDIKLAQRTLSFPIVSYGRPLVAGGQNENIQTGQIVLVKQTLIGLIGEVSSSQAEIQLLSQEGTLPILAYTESGYQGLIVGDGKRVRLTEIPPEAQIKEGERIVTAGQVGIPRDIFIGRIATIRVSPADSMQNVVIDQIVSFYESELVEIR